MFENVLKFAKVYRIIIKLRPTVFLIPKLQLGFDFEIVEIFRFSPT